MRIGFFHLKGVSRDKRLWWQCLNPGPPRHPKTKNAPNVEGLGKKFFGEMFGGLVFSFYLCTHKRWQKCLSVVKDLSHGVMASTTGFGSVSQGSNPCGTTTPAGGGQRFSSLLQYRNTKHLLLSSRETLWLGVTHDGDELIDSKLIQIVLWCNGSTTDSGPVCQGSNPCRTTAYHTYTVARVSQRARYMKGPIAQLV